VRHHGAVAEKTDATTTVQAQTGARRRAATRHSIVAATRRLLLEGETYGALSMERIAREAGVSRATLYLHFKDKKDVIAQLADEIVEQRFALGAESLADPHIGRDVLDGIIADMVDRWVTDGPILDAIVELAEQDDEMRAVWVKAIHEVGAMGAQLMRERWADRPGELPDTEMIGQVLAWMFERSTHQLARDPAGRDRLTAAVAEVVWRVFDHDAST
jgi:TetR/AcrR family transcriptional regulator, ethionamide resistance regulator